MPSRPSPPTSPTSSRIPLTSLRSAVETLPYAKTTDQRDRLTAIVKDDVKRLDRLITDISDASRLDAELARARNHPVECAACSKR